jgi:hypothetical protein
MGTTDFQVINKDPESITIVRRVLQTLAPAARSGVSQTDERWFLLDRQTRNALYGGPFNRFWNTLLNAVKKTEAAPNFSCDSSFFD